MSFRAPPDTVVEYAAAGRSRRPGAVLAFSLLLVAVNLRIAIAAVAPVLDDIRDDYHLSTTVAGLITTVPVVCFGAFAFAAPRLTRRTSPERVLVLAMAVLTGGILLRLIPSVTAVFLGTVLVGAPIAVGNVLLPGLIKRDFAARAGLMMGLYSTMLYVGPAMSSGLTVPFDHATDSGWRPALAVWAAPSVLAALFMLPWARAATPAHQVRELAPVTGLWRDRTAWWVTLSMGLQSTLYYSLMAWLPTFFTDHGMSDSEAGWMMSFSTFPGMAAALIAPSMVRRLPRPWLGVLIGTALSAFAFVGLLSDPISLSYLWMAALGFSQGMMISLALSFIVARSRDPHHTTALSTMAQGIGYLIAAVGPFGLGALHDATGGWTAPLLAVLAVLPFYLFTGVLASRDRHVLT